ncbi:MAG: hypothetical protein JNK02_16280 [Planctomycetes bacterium]|nr:hypothetical protein [Planctomycetota bacterium]
MRLVPSLAATALLAACTATASVWSPIPRPWTPEVVDVQRRVRVLPRAGPAFEVERPRLEPEGQPVLAWRGAGPDERYPARSIPLAEVADLEAVAPKPGSVGGDRLYQAGLVTVGVILWALILVAIFT